jgi:hypothetical protein
MIKRNINLMPRKSIVPVHIIKNSNLVKRRKGYRQRVINWNERFAQMEQMNNVGINNGGNNGNNDGVNDKRDINYSYDSGSYSYDSGSYSYDSHSCSNNDTNNNTHNNKKKDIERKGFNLRKYIKHFKFVTSGERNKQIIKANRERWRKRGFANLKKRFARHHQSK